MVKLIAGKKGSGKTKCLIEAIHTAEKESKGNVVAIQYGSSLNIDIYHKIRLINIEDYKVSGYNDMYGVVAGLLASNYDITDIFIDSSMKLCGGDVAAFETFVSRTEAISADVNVVISASIPAEELPESLKKYV